MRSRRLSKGDRYVQLSHGGHSYPSRSSPDELKAVAIATCLRLKELNVYDTQAVLRSLDPCLLRNEQHANTVHESHVAEDAMNSGWGDDGSEISASERMARHK